MPCARAWWTESPGRWLRVLLLGMMPAWAHAQHLLFESYQQAAGLAVVSLMQAGDGSLWIGTEGGLLHFDGFGVRRDPLPADIRHARILTGVADHQGRVWLATDIGLYLRSQSHGQAPRWTKVRGTDGKVLVVEEGQHLDIDAKGRVYALDQDQHLWVIDAPEPGDIQPAPRRLATPAFPLSPNGMNAAAGPIRVGFGALWFGCGKGLCELREGRLRQWGQADGLPERKWAGLLIARDGSVWARSADVLAHLEPAVGQFTAVDAPAARIGTFTSGFGEDPQGRIVLATDEGLARWDGQHWQRWLPNTGLPPTIIRSLLFDAKGELWLGTAGRGFHRWIGYGRVDHWTESEGLPSPVVTAIEQAANDRLWIGTTRGIAWLDKHTHRLRSPNWRGSSVASVSDLAIDTQGDLWWRDAEHHLMHLRPGSGQVERAFGDASVDTVLQGGAGQVYIQRSSDFQRVYRAPGGLRRERVADDLPGQEAARSIAIDGSIEWFIGEQHAFRLENGRWSEMRDERGRPIDVRGLGSFARAHEFWTVDLQAVAVYDVSDKGIAHLMRRFELTQFGDPTAYFLKAGPHGEIWLGTDAGVFVFNSGRWSHLDHSNGLLWDDLSDNAIVLASDGSAWIGSSAGLTHVRQLPTDPAPVLRLTSLTFGGTFQANRSAASIPWQDRHLHLVVATDSFGQSHQYHVEYRLDSHSPWQGLAQNELDIATPEQGAHVIELRAAPNWPILEAGPTLQLSFVIQPPWWRSRLALTLYAAMVLAAWWFSSWMLGRHQRAERRRLERAVARRTTELEASRKILSQLGERKLRQLEEERRRIARELHDEMGQQLAALRMEASVLRMRQADGASGQGAFQLLIQRIDGLSAAVRGLVRQLRPPALDGGLGAALAWLASEFRQATGVPCQIEVDASANTLPMEIGEQVFRLAQELLTNVRRHAQASRVELSLKHRKAGWVLSVSDNGRGFNVDAQHLGYGLLGMKERAELLGGEIVMDSQPGEGTTVTVWFSIHGLPHDPTAANQTA